MIVSDIFTRDAATCTPLTPLQQAIESMLERNCGFVPVVDPDGSIAGVLTDRDACLALAAHRRTAAHVAAEEAMTRPVFSCFMDDDVAAALKTMRERRVRRLPVLDRAGRLQGVLSLDDVVVNSAGAEPPLVDGIVATLRAICAHKSVELAAD
jgi:CBS domain-containing protein